MERDAFINRLGRWNDPVAVAKAHAISAQIWSDYQQGSFDRSLMAYQPLVNGKQVALLEALRVRQKQTPGCCNSRLQAAGALRSPSAPEAMQRSFCVG